MGGTPRAIPAGTAAQISRIASPKTAANANVAVLFELQEG
jgi:hypothetical protein